MTVFASEHLNVFKKLFALHGQNWMGHIPDDWAKVVFKNSARSQPINLSKKRVSRGYLFDRSLDLEVSDLDVCIEVLSWGGMTRPNGAKAFQTWKMWNPIISELRHGKLSRSEAYEKFHSLRTVGQLSGMGPAYFTKLIYFCDPKHDGYILDQWTSRSANLLGISPEIKLYRVPQKNRKDFFGVSDKNTPKDYNRFCNFVECLAEEIPQAETPSAVEEAMFSEGRGRGLWRNYVISQTELV